MKKLFWLLAAIFLLAIMACSGGGGGGDAAAGTANNDVGKVERLDPAKIATDPQTGQQYVNDQILITFKDSVSESDATAKITSINGTIVGYITGFNDYQVRISGNPTLAQLQALVDQLNSDPMVDAAKIHTVIQINKIPDSGKDPQWFAGIFNLDTWNEDDPWGNNWGLEAIKAPSAWDYNNEMNSVKIGIVDAGFQLDHEDLKIPSENSLNSDVAHYHGTHVAGIIGATSNNDVGITGIVWKRELYVYGGGGTDNVQDFDIKFGIVSVLKKGAKVINLSLGNSFHDEHGIRTYTPSDNRSSDVTDLITKPKKMWESFANRLMNKGYDFLIVQAAGNDWMDSKWGGLFNTIDDLELRKRIIIVGAIQRNSGGWFGENTYAFASFSNYGSKVDVVAPGKDIYSTFFTDKDHTNSYEKLSGTSMAAPHVTGVAALMWAIKPALTATQVKNIIVGTADRPVSNYNIVNAFKAVERARSTDATQPIQRVTGIVMGRVVDTNGNGIIDAGISVLEGTDYGTYAGSTLTDSEGSYMLILPPGQYKLYFSKAGYITDSYEVNVTADVTTYNATLTSVSTADSGNGTVGGYIINAFTGVGVNGLTLNFRRGLNVTTGSIAGSTTSGAAGAYISTLPAGNYTVEIVGNSSYSTGYFYVVAVGNRSIGNQNGSITPVMPAGQTRIILRWGVTPSDLDSHLTGPLLDGTRFHIYYPLAEANSGSTWPLYVKLDLDDTTSYGPETTTIYSQIDGVYRFSVHDYTNRSSSNSNVLSNSGAQVQVYRGGSLVATFDVPSNIGGTLWTVFEMNGDTITPINTMSYTSDPSAVRQAIRRSSYNSDVKLMQNLPVKR
jgi:subtilisin family serine protease